VSALEVHIWARHVRAIIYRAAQMRKRIKEGNYEASPAKKEFDKRKKKRELTLADPKVLVFKNAIKLYAVLGRNPSYSTYLLEHLLVQSRVTDKPNHGRVQHNSSSQNQNHEKHRSKGRSIGKQSLFT